MGGLSVQIFSVMSDIALLLYAGTFWLILPILLFLSISFYVKEKFIKAQREIIRLGRGFFVMRRIDFEKPDCELFHGVAVGASCDKSFWAGGEVHKDSLEQYQFE